MGDFTGRSPLLKQRQLSRADPMLHLKHRRARLSGKTECQRRNKCIAAVHRMHDLVSSAHKSNRGLVQLDAAKAALATAEEQLGTLKAADGRQKLDLENVRRGASEVQQQRDALADERCAA